MRKRKGAALPAAIIACIFLLTISFAIAAFVLEAVAYNTINRTESNRQIVFASANEEFKNGREITNTTYTWEIYEGENSLKALAAYNSVDKLSFVSLYDFNNKEQLLYQTSNFYIVTINDEQYIAGLVKIIRGE